MNRKRFLLGGMATAVIAGLAGCGTVSGAYDKVISFVGLKGTRVAWNEVVIAASDGANQNSPLGVDIVFAIEQPAVEKLSAMSAAKWFASRADMRRTFPGELSYKSWELTPGQILRLPGSVFGSLNVMTVFVFADYMSPGEHRIRVDHLQNGIIVQLGARDFTVQPKVD